MKIILKAFNKKLSSEPIEVPDNTSPDFFLPMPLENLEYNSKKDVYDTSNLIMKKAHFQRTNYVYSLKDLGYELINNEDPSAYEYVLIDIN